MNRYNNKRIGANTEQIIKDLQKNPFAVLDKLSIKEIVALIKEANSAYHQEGKPLFSDETYDIILSYLARLVPNHPILTSDVGSLPKKNKVKLPLWMGSLDKIKDDPDVLNKWRNDHKGDYIISDKLDGISCLLVNDNDKVILYSRGDGNMGQDISHLIRFIDNIPTKLPNGLMVRGELIISRDSWKTISNQRSNPRNTVAGLANSKKPAKDLAKLIDFIAYELIQPQKKPSEGHIYIKKLGMANVNYSKVNEQSITVESLSTILLKRREGSSYEIDGIVITHDDINELPEQENPHYSFAFKSVLTHEKAEVIVKDVTWKVSKNALLKPVVVFDRVKLSGVHIHKATAHNAQYIVKNKIGPGSKIIIIRSGDVIPYIFDVVTISASGEPSYPNQIDYPWKWNATKVDICLENPDSAEEYQLRLLENYSNVLAIKGLSPNIINKLYNIGITSIKKLVNITKSDLYKATLSSKVTMKIYNQMQNVYQKGSCVEFMVASNIFGTGMGKRKLQMISDLYPSILENKPPSLGALLDTKGVGERFARQLLDNLADFHEFIEEVGLPCRSNTVDVEETPEGLLSVYGKTIVFTGFRSKELEELIIKRGGKVGSSVSQRTTLLVAKNVDDTNIKIEQAKEIDIPIMSLKEFSEEVGFKEAPKPLIDHNEIDKEFELLKAELEKEGELLEDNGDDDEEDDATLNKSAECVRHALNWANMKRTQIFGKSTFDPESFKNDLEKASPKLVTVLNNINKLDAEDMKMHGKMFKHMVFSDVTKRGFGAKIVAAGLQTYGFNHAYGKDFKINKKQLAKTKGNNFAVLASTQIYTKPINVEFKKELLTTFNSRPRNIYGNDIRLIVLDSGYKEGIDLFDVKYVHLYEPTLTYADQVQAIGRATRLCGQKGLHFEPGHGWRLHVFKYDHTLPPDLATLYNGNNSFQLIMNEIKRDQNWVNLAIDLERVCCAASIDVELTRKIDFKKSIKNLLDESIYNNKSSHHKQHQKGGEYSAFRWPTARVEDLCNDTVNQGKLLQFSPSQEFIRQYFVPSSNLKGMLLWHSLGSGKTCTAISTASLSWEAEGYTILWVTRGTLRSDVYKNIFDMSCMERLRDLIKAGIDIPENMAKRKRLLSRSWLPPISFKQFTNLLSKQNMLYNFMLKRNGFTDPFRRTLIIIDEAHLMMSPTMKPNDKPDLDLLKKWIRQSYKVSGKDSLRLLLMSATPITDNPFNLVKLINLTSDIDLPDKEEEFTQKYLNQKDLSFTASGELVFKREVAGRISYLNRTRDIRQFAQPIIKSIDVPISRPADMKPFLDEIVKIENDIESLKHIKVGDTKKALIEQIESKYSDILAECETKGKATDKKICISETKKLMREEKATADEIAKGMVTDAKAQKVELKEKHKYTKKNMKEAKKNDLSIASVLEKRCYRKEKDTAKKSGKKSGLTTPRTT